MKEYTITKLRQLLESDVKLQSLIRRTKSDLADAQLLLATVREAKRQGKRIMAVSKSKDRYDIEKASMCDGYYSEGKVPCVVVRKIPVENSRWTIWDWAELVDTRGITHLEYDDGEKIESLEESDARLRELHRRWLASDSDESLVQFLFALVNSGKKLKDFGLDHKSRFKRDFDRIKAYVKGPLKGILTVETAGTSQAPPYITYRIDFGMADASKQKGHTLQTTRIRYPNDAQLELSIKDMKKMDPSHINWNLMLQSVKGWGNRFNTHSVATMPGPSHTIRVAVNKALEHVLGNRLKY